MAKIHRPHRRARLSPPGNIPMPDWVEAAAARDGVSVDEAWAATWEFVCYFVRKHTISHEELLKQLAGSRIYLHFPRVDGKIQVEYVVNNDRI